MGSTSAALWVPLLHRAAETARFPSAARSLRLGGGILLPFIPKTRPVHTGTQHQTALRADDGGKGCSLVASSGPIPCDRTGSPGTQKGGGWRGPRTPAVVCQRGPTQLPVITSSPDRAPARAGLLQVQTVETTSRATQISHPREDCRANTHRPCWSNVTPEY